MENKVLLSNIITACIYSSMLILFFMNQWEHLSITLKNSLKLDIIQMLESFVDNSEAVWRWVIRAYHDTYTNFKHSIP